MLPEATITVVWPTLGATAAGRWVGRLCGLEPRWDRLHLVSKAMALSAIPAALGLFFWQLMPGICRRYRLTNRRIIVQKGLQPRDEHSLALEEFDAIAVDVRPGQAWLHGGDLVFQREGREMLRLAGVSRPEVFRQSCLKARTALVATQQVLAAQAAAKPGPAADEQVRA